MKNENQITALIFAVTTLLYGALRAPLTWHDEHARVAWAILHGHTWIDDIVMKAGRFHTTLGEHATVAGHGYSIHPPLAAFLSIPFVAAGITNEVTISVLFGALAVALMWRLTHSLWLTALFGFGTPFGYEASLGASWGMCSTISCVFTLLALLSVKKGSAARTGLFAGFAALARYDLVLTWPVYLLWSVCTTPSLGRRRRLVTFGAFLLPALLIYVAWNEVRFGTILDASILQFYTHDAYVPPAGRHGPFSLYYLPYSIYLALFSGPSFNQRWIFSPNIAGQALILTSPALLLALRPSLLARETLLLWAAVILGMGACMLVYASGFEQFGCRYWIQVLPFMVLLISKKPIEQMGKILIVASILIVTVGTLQLRGWI